MRKVELIDSEPPIWAAFLVALQNAPDPSPESGRKLQNSPDLGLTLAGGCGFYVELYLGCSYIEHYTEYSD